MSDMFNRSNQLLTNILFESVNNYPTFTHIKSIFSDEWYNFIAPHVTSDKLAWDEINSIITQENKRDFKLSYYISEQLLADYSNYFSEHKHNKEIGTEYYIFKSSKDPITELGELVLVDDSLIEEYVSMGKICFPDWENNETYARYVYQRQQESQTLIIKNYLFRYENQFVGFCGIIASPKQNLAYFHNVGVLPAYRRRGHFTSITHHVINTSLSFGITDTYALIEYNGNSYHGLTKLGYESVDKYHLFSTIV